MSNLKSWSIRFDVSVLVLWLSISATGAELVASKELGIEQEAAEVEVQFKQAKQLEAAGDHASAATAFANLAAAHGRIPRAQKSELAAALNYKQAGQAELALRHFDRAIQMQIGTSIAEEAFLQKAVLCAATGRTGEAVKAAQYLRYGYPYSARVPRAIRLAGQAQQLSETGAEAIISTEAEAIAIVKQADSALLGKDKRYDMALQLLSRVEAGYPNTAAAIAATATKGSILDETKQYEAASAILAPLAARIDSLAPKSPMADRVNGLLGESHSLRAQELLDQAVQRGALVTEEYKAIKNRCDQVLNLGCNQAQIAGARVLLVEIELLNRDPAKASALSKGFMREYAGSGKLRRFPRQVMQLWLAAAEAARLNHNIEEALKLNERVKDMFLELPDDVKKHPKVREAYVQAFYQCYLAKRWSGADRDSVQASGLELIEKFPESNAARSVKKQLGLGNDVTGHSQQ